MLIQRSPKTKKHQTHRLSAHHSHRAIRHSPITLATSKQSSKSFSSSSQSSSQSLYEYKTIDSPIENTLLKEKGSKFIGYAYQISNETDFQESLDHVKSLHPRATHHCYAYRMGPSGENSRANDDGEPAGSAGLPILNQLLASGITNVLMVVVRYYGGVKLGVSGLIKAYKESTKITIDQATIITCELENCYTIKFKDFSQQNHIYSLLNKHNARVEDCEYAQRDGDDNIMTSWVKLSNEQTVLKLVQEISLDIKIDLKYTSV